MRQGLAVGLLRCEAVSQRQPLTPTPAPVRPPAPLRPPTPAAATSETGHQQLAAQAGEAHDSHRILAAVEAQLQVPPPLRVRHSAC